jgi:hypothetical protein
LLMGATEGPPLTSVSEGASRVFTGHFKVETALRGPLRLAGGPGLALRVRPATRPLAACNLTAATGGPGGAWPEQRPPFHPLARSVPGAGRRRLSDKPDPPASPIEGGTCYGQWPGIILAAGQCWSKTAHFPIPVKEIMHVRAMFNFPCCGTTAPKPYKNSGRTGREQ